MDKPREIVLRDGPAGVRPGLPDGPNVWEVVAVHRSFADVQRTADWLNQPASAVEIALGYYGRHRNEIDAWILENDEAAEAARNAGRSSR